LLYSQLPFESILSAGHQFFVVVGLRFVWCLADSISDSLNPFRFIAKKVSIMASGLFIGLTEDELLLIKCKAVSLITEGKTTMSYSDSGSSVSKNFVMHPKDMLDEAMYALSILDPNTYGKQNRVLRPSWRNGRDVF
jgi:hypothetical protein